MHNGIHAQNVQNHNLHPFYFAYKQIFGQGNTNASKKKEKQALMQDRRSTNLTVDLQRNSRIVYQLRNFTFEP